MATQSVRTKVLVVLMLANFISEIYCHNNDDDSQVTRPHNLAMDDIKAADHLLRGSGEEIDEEISIPFQRIKTENVEIEKNLRATEMQGHQLNYERNPERINDMDIINPSILSMDANSRFVTTEVIPTTTDTAEEIPEALGLKNTDEEKNIEDDYYNLNRNVENPDRIDDISDGNVTSVTTDVTETVTDGVTLSMIDNDVYKSRDSVVGDVYNNGSNNVEAKLKTESTTQATTKAVNKVNMETLVPRIAEFEDDLEVIGDRQRSPKTENTEPKQPNDRRNYDVKPRPPPTVTKSSTLKGWLEDTWVRPPAGILVPLRPMALNRALAVWNDLTAVEGLNVSDIVILGYDSNGVNWRSRHNLQGTSAGNGNQAVAVALSKLLLKYQGFHTDATSDGTMRALASAAKLVPYDSALFVVTDKGAGDPQRLPLALRALVEKRLKVYTIWTNPSHPSTESELALRELTNISRHTEGDVLHYSLQVTDMDSSSNLASELHQWKSSDNTQPRTARLSSKIAEEQFETILVKRGGGGATSLGIPVENGASALRVYIEGAVTHAVLYPPNDGPQIDLYNESSVRAFSPASRTESLLPRKVYLIFPGAELDRDILSVLPVPTTSSETVAETVGVWHLSLRCDTCDYRVTVGARAQIHFETAGQAKGILKLRVTGPVASVRETTLVDEFGPELAKLPFSYQPLVSDGQTEPLDAVTELVADVAIPAFKETKVYAKIVGRDIRGEPFARLSGPLSRKAETRTGRSASIIYPDPDPINDLELVEQVNSRVYNSKLQYNESAVLPHSRAVSQVVSHRGTILTAVQIGLSSRLYGAPGDSLQLHFEVTNYREQAVNFIFEAVGELKFLRSINPARQTIASGQTANVIVNVGITNTAQPGARDLITFTAYSGIDRVSISTYVYVLNPGETMTDVWSPEIRHNFQGTCIGRTGDDCAQHIWSATIIATDSLGGLLRLTSSPMGLLYDSNFIAGSRDQVVATYRATCCAPRLVVTAVDTYGNANSYAIDISNYFTGAAIAAIVLGVILAIALIVLIIFLVYWCVKRRRESRELPSYSTSSRNVS